MTDLLTDALPTVWHGRRIDPDFRHMVRLSAAYSHGEVEADPVAFALQLCGQFYTERFSAPDLERLWQGVIEFYRMGEQAAAGISDTDASPDTGPALVSSTSSWPADVKSAREILGCSNRSSSPPFRAQVSAEYSPITRLSQPSCNSQLRISPLSGSSCSTA